MIPRRPKLIAAAAVLAAGLALAWPWRRTENLTVVFPPLDVSAPATLPVSQQLAPPEASSAASLAATAVGLSGELVVDPPGRREDAPLASTVDQPPLDMRASVSSSPPAAPDSPSAERVHIVHQGDSLERLAKRYLGDAGRAIELFDLNRDRLENPHLLPIGAELRIPQTSNAGKQDSAQ